MAQAIPVLSGQREAELELFADMRVGVETAYEIAWIDQKLLQVWLGLCELTSLCKRQPLFALKFFNVVTEFPGPFNVMTNTIQTAKFPVGAR